MYQVYNISYDCNDLSNTSYQNHVHRQKKFYFSWLSEVTFFYNGYYENVMEWLVLNFQVLSTEIESFMRF